MSMDSLTARIDGISGHYAGPLSLCFTSKQIYNHLRFFLEDRVPPLVKDT